MRIDRGQLVVTNSFLTAGYTSCTSYPKKNINQSFYEFSLDLHN